MFASGKVAWKKNLARIMRALDCALSNGQFGNGSALAA